MSLITQLQPHPDTNLTPNPDRNRNNPNRNLKQ